MIKGEIRCTCGQFFGFESRLAEVKCPTCGKVYLTVEYGQIVEETTDTTEVTVESELEDLLLAEMGVPV